MDGGPFRVPRPAERRVAGRPESATPRRAEPANEPRVADEEKPRAARSSSSQRSSAREKRSPRFIKSVAVVIAILAVVVLGWLGWSKIQGGGGMVIDAGKYQAVSISDGQIYFGKLSAVNDEYVKLSGAYYLQAQPTESEDADSKQQPATQGDVKLIKLENKIYGPENEIVIAKSQIISYENLQPEGQVAKWLKDNADK